MGLSAAHSRVLHSHPYPWDSPDPIPTGRKVAAVGRGRAEVGEQQQAGEWWQVGVAAGGQEVVADRGGCKGRAAVVVGGQRGVVGRSTETAGQEHGACTGAPRPEAAEAQGGMIEEQSPGQWVCGDHLAQSCRAP